MSRSWRWIVGSVLAIFCTATTVVAYDVFFSIPRVGQIVSVNIPEQATASTAADALAHAGVIRSSLIYRVLSFFASSAQHPHAGTYVLSPGMNLITIAHRLAAGPMREERTWLVREGETLEDETQLLVDHASFDPRRMAQVAGGSKNSSPFDPAWREEFPFLRQVPVSRSLEGYAFPETYRVWTDQLPESLIRKQLQQFSVRFGSTSPGPASAPLTTLDQVVTLASIVEKEVQTPRDRRLVAGIFLRRLRVGMPLQSDATLTYITGSMRGRATRAELTLDSPYNTYLSLGLPPSPISNPGEDAIRSVLNPIQSPYLYFLTDAKGTVLYAKTLDEHARNRTKAGY